MKHQACTSILVGKKASLNNSVIIGRNEDFGEVINRKTFKIFEPFSKSDNIYESANTKVRVNLPLKGYRHSGNPSDDPNEIGNYTEGAINEVNVAISATESLYGNERVLSYDPLVKDGIAEDAIVDLVIPFINSAKEGVEYLGLLIEKWGSAEGNGVLFADKDECWYMEIPTGHHWVAVRIPDDCYAIAPNQVCIQEIDFDDLDNYRFSTGILEFVEKYHLNPHPDTFNFRNVFGTSTKQDRVYNTPRAWFGHRYFNPENDFQPESSDIPFIQKANRLISIEDVDYFLSSHFNETPYDPIGRGAKEDKTKYRAISLSRTQESHILEIRNIENPLLKSIHYTAFGTTAFTPYIPFFIHSHDVDECISKVPLNLDLNNAYWLFKVISYYTETHFNLLEKDNLDFLIHMQILARQRIDEITNNFNEDEDYLSYFTNENNKTLRLFIEESQKYLNQCMIKALGVSKLSFKMDPNL